MRWPIRNQILVPFAATMLVALVSVSGLNAWLAANNSALQIEQQLSGLAHSLTISHFPLTDAVLAQMRELSGADFILADTSGKVRASSRTVDSRLLPTDAAAAGAGATVKLDTRLAVGDERYFHTAVALVPRSSDEPPATLHILYPERSWREARWAAAWPSLVVGAVALTAVALLALVIAQGLSRPISEVQRQVSRLTQADFQAIPLPARDDELRDLVISVNRLAEQLDDMRQAIQRGERLSLLGQLSGGLAHHLRNDVTGAKMAVQLHQQHCTADDRESLAVALRQLALTEEHLKRFLAAGKPQELNTASCELAEIVGETAALLQPSLEHRKIELRTTISPTPAILADLEQLRHLLMNLVLNAADAAQPGGWVGIDVALAAPSWITIRVRDSGQGPVAEIVDRLFEPFATDKPEGVGLGLAVARQIAEAHGGTLDYTRIAEATCFELKLPVPSVTPAT